MQLYKSFKFLKYDIFVLNTKLGRILVSDHFSALRISAPWQLNLELFTLFYLVIYSR